jgi:signal transduction histidine kinase
MGRGRPRSGGAAPAARHLRGRRRARAQRLAEGIHDDSIQVIAALGMRLQMLRRTLEDPEQLAFLTEARAVRSSPSAAAHLVELHPPGLEQEGLSAALDRPRRAQRIGGGLQLRRPVARAAADRDVRHPLRIAQEALDNARAHAGALADLVTLLERDADALRASPTMAFDPALPRPDPVSEGLPLRQRSRARLRSLQVELSDEARPSRFGCRTCSRARRHERKP